MVLPALLLVLLMVYNGLSYPSLDEDQWELFKLTHNKVYAKDHEEHLRRSIFMENMRTIIKHNKLYEMGLTTWFMGMNQFGDLTKDEFQRYYLTSVDPTNNVDDKSLPQENISPTYLPSNKKLPHSIDWRLRGAVTAVKNQLKCMACYAFCATGALEAQTYIKMKKLVSLSEQNIVDCTFKVSKYGNNGCLGGNVEGTFKYIIDNKGIDTEQSYPFMGVIDEDGCNFSSSSVGATMTAIKKLPPGNETELQMAVGTIGPVAAMVDAKNMRFYAGGIYDDTSCSRTAFNHGFLVIGYGTFKKWPYWIIKNSWGEGWGEVGYMMMMRNKNNLCGVASAALYPIV